MALRVPPDGEPEDLVGNLQYQSAGDVHTKGEGASIRFDGRTTHSYLNVAWSNATFRPTLGERDALPANPEWVASAGLSGRVAPWTASVAAKAVGSQRLDPSRESGESTDPFVQLNLHLLWRPTSDIRSTSSSTFENSSTKKVATCTPDLLTGHVSDGGASLDARRVDRVLLARTIESAAG